MNEIYAIIIAKSNEANLNYEFYNLILLRNAVNSVNTFFTKSEENNFFETDQIRRYIIYVEDS